MSKSSRVLTVSDKANIFHDPYSGVTIAKGEKKELSIAQLANRRVRAAIQSGHLVYAELNETSDEVLDIPALLDKAKKIASEAKAETKMPKKFNLDELKALVTHLDYQIEDTDTRETLSKILIEEFTTSK